MKAGGGYLSDNTGAIGGFLTLGFSYFALILQPLVGSPVSARALSTRR
jgi:hypothetical protein